MEDKPKTNDKAKVVKKKPKPKRIQPIFRHLIKPSKDSA